MCRGGGCACGSGCCMWWWLKILFNLKSIILVIPYVHTERLFTTPSRTSHTHAHTRTYTCNATVKSWFLATLRDLAVHVMVLWINKIQTDVEIL